MAILFTGNTNIIDFPVAHDPQDEKYYTFAWRPAIWQPSTNYFREDLILPTEHTGFYYVCTDPGISGEDTPVFPTQGKTTFESGTTKWKTFPYNFLLRPEDTIAFDDLVTVDAPEIQFISSDENITISNVGTDGSICWCKLSTIPENINSFLLTNRVHIIRSNGAIERFDRSVRVPVKEL
jgi:hypothetical protein